MALWFLLPVLAAAAPSFDPSLSIAANILANENEGFSTLAALLNTTAWMTMGITTQLSQAPNITFFAPDDTALGASPPYGFGIDATAVNTPGALNDSVLQMIAGVLMYTMLPYNVNQTQFVMDGYKVRPTMLSLTESLLGANHQVILTWPDAGLGYIATMYGVEDWSFNTSINSTCGVATGWQNLYQYTDTILWPPQLTTDTLALLDAEPASVYPWDHTDFLWLVGNATLMPGVNGSGVVDFQNSTTIFAYIDFDEQESTPQLLDPSVILVLGHSSMSGVASYSTMWNPNITNVIPAVPLVSAAQNLTRNITVTYNATDGSWWVNSYAKILAKDILTANGVMHIIGSTLWAPNDGLTVMQNLLWAQPTIFLGVAGAVAYAPSLVGPALTLWNTAQEDFLTFLCPQPSAVAAIATSNNAAVLEEVLDILLYHTTEYWEAAEVSKYETKTSMMNDSAYVQLGGKAQRIEVWKNGTGIQVASNVTANLMTGLTDIECSNGYIQVIDSILWLPYIASASVAMGHPQVNNAMTKYNVQAMLNNGTNLMAFLPTEAAFNATNWHGWNEKSVILGWAATVPTVAYLDSWTSATITSWANSTLTLAGSSSGWTVTDVNGTVANVVGYDNLVQNGVILWVDKVLWPAMMPNGAGMVSASFIVVALAVFLNFLH